MRASPTAIAAGLLVLTLAGVASADHGPEEVQAHDTTIEEPVAPLGSPGEAVLPVEVPCTEEENGTVEARAELAQAPETLVFDARDGEADLAEACPESHTLVLEVPVEVRFTQQAPAFEPQQADVDVHVQKQAPDGNTTTLPPAQASVTATPDYFNQFNANLQTKIAEAGPQEQVRYTIAIDNYSNGDTRFTFSLPAELPGGFEAVVPSPMVIQTNATGGDASDEATFTVFTPFHNGWVNEVGAIQLRIDSFYAANTSIEGNSTQLSTLTKTQGMHVPGPGAGLALLSLAGLAVAARKQAP